MSTDGVIECALATDFGRCGARRLLAKWTSASCGVSVSDGVRAANGYAHCGDDGSRGAVVLGETATALVRSDGGERSSVRLPEHPSVLFSDTPTHS